jgi:16S rRNA (guanine966-N2)-methyltransferase
LGELRIIAGRLRGRRIRVPPGVAVRPTPDRVRESLFAILGAVVRDARVLDAYAGSGALGLEAWSRGAASVVFIESDASALEVLRRNVSDLGLREPCRVLAGRVEDILRHRPPRGPFGLVLADPPYADRDVGIEFLRWIEAAGILAPGATIVLQRDRRGPAAGGAGGLRAYRTERYGRTCLDFLAAPPGGLPDPPKIGN